MVLSAAHWGLARPIPISSFAEPEVQEQPQPAPASRLDRTSKSIPFPRDRPPFMVDTTVLPRDNQRGWLLDFKFRPLRIKTVEIPGKGRRQIHYLYYMVVNRTSRPRTFVPQFIMVNEKGQSMNPTRPIP